MLIYSAKWHFFSLACSLLQTLQEHFLRYNFMEELKNFFWMCSGAHRETLEGCRSESGKYAGIGATIFFTGLFAAIAGGYALYTVFDNVIWAMLFGIVWGLMIFNLD